MPRRAYVSSENAATMVAIALVGDGLIALTGPVPWYGYALMIVIALFCLRCALCGLWVRGDKLTVVNPLSRFRTVWTAVDHFDLARWGPFALVAWMHLRDGTKVHILGLAPPNPTTRPNNRAAQATITELNAAAAARADTASTPR